MRHELGVRLLPAVIAHWPAGIASVERLIERSATMKRLCGRGAAMVHTDVHLGNVLCRVADQRVECVGLLDLDEAAGGATEWDLASFHVLHGPLFQREIDPALRDEVATGYDAELDDVLLEHFRCMHLANQGFSSALLGHDDHARQIAIELAGRLHAARA
jgi:Ser/Thr protein kinase RdoA (MazF antagonist)